MQWNVAPSRRFTQGVLFQTDCSSAARYGPAPNRRRKHLNNNGIFHRDLKPKNILYRTSPDLVMKVANFGCSRFLSRDTTHYTRSMSDDGYLPRFREFGTDGWLAQEVINGVTQLRPPHAIDIYPMGLIFVYNMCRGKHPYGEYAKTRDKLIKNKQPILENIKQELIDERGIKCNDLINQMVHPNPDARPTTAEVLEDHYFRPPPIIRDSVLLNFSVDYALTVFVLISFLNQTDRRETNCLDCAAWRDHFLLRLLVLWHY